MSLKSSVFLLVNLFIVNLYLTAQTAPVHEAPKEAPSTEAGISPISGASPGSNAMGISLSGNSQISTINQAVTSPSGSFNWSYPLNIPAGTNGIEPSLALTYNSSVGNGMIGMGFQLSGFSTIERDSSRGVNFTSTDSYVLDGQKLYSKTNDPTFHTERESFDLINAYSSGSLTLDPNLPGTYWVVKKKDGTQYFYGSGRQYSNSQIVAIGKKEGNAEFGAPLTRLWALDKVIDPNGNYYTIDYYQDGSGAYYPLTINYTLKTDVQVPYVKQINFYYENRNDKTPIYAPTKVETKLRLKWITILSNVELGNEYSTQKLVRKYRLDYRYSELIGSSELSAITEYGNEGNIPRAVGLLDLNFVGTGMSLPPIMLWWGNDSNFFGANDWTGLSSSGTPNTPYPGDFNGDGKMDIGIWIGSGRFAITLASEDQTFGSSYSSETAALPYNSEDQMYTPYPADYDGDGKTDIAVKSNIHGRWLIDYSYNEFGIWDFPETGTTPLYVGDNAIAVPADYDGDGKTDISVKTLNGDWNIYYAKDGFRTLGFGGKLYGGYDAHPYPADYDGDGKTDISVKCDDGRWLIDYAANLFGSWDYTKNNAPQIRIYGDSSVVPVPADYDGDGKIDLSIKTNDGRWYIDYAGDGFGSWGYTGVGYSAYDGSPVTPVPADYDGDGKIDIAIKSSKGQWYIDYAGDGFGKWGYPVAGASPLNIYGDQDSIPVPADYDGEVLELATHLARMVDC